MANLDVPGYIIAILWVALAFSIFANIILIRQKFFGINPKRDKQRRK